MSISSIQSVNYQDTALYSKPKTRVSSENTPPQSTADKVSFSPQARALLEAENPKKEISPEEFKTKNFKDRDTPEAKKEVATSVTLLQIMMDALVLAQLAENEDSIVAAPADAPAVQTTQDGTPNAQGNTAQAAPPTSPVKETAEAVKSKPSAMFGNTGKVSEIKQIMYTMAGGKADISDVSRAMGSASTPPSSMSKGESGGAKASAKNDSESPRLLVT